MPWIFFALAFGCFAIAFRTHSMGLAALALLAALGLMLAGTLGLASARVSRATRGNAGLLGPEELRLVAEHARRKQAEGPATAPARDAGQPAADAVTPEPANPSATEAPESGAPR